ncbi:sensor histidine kinase [Paenibacillus chitinolyticus]|uniref:sensor histidine kinase n=1 Tax=Paenibacillus chitinolyticus TaxID=79263 RepID=UPI00362C91F1
MRISLKWKFALFIAALLLFAVGVLSVLVLNGVHRYQKEEMEKTLDRQAEIANNRIGQQVVTGTRFDPQTFMGLQGQNLAVEIGAASGMRFLLYDMTGARTGDSLPLAESPDVSGVLSHALNNKIVYRVLGDTEDYLAPAQGPDGQIGVLHFQVSLAASNAFYRNLQNSFLLAGSGVLLFSFVLGLLYMNRQAKAIRRLKEAADDIRVGAFIDAPPFRRQDELGSLSDGIYEMSRAIQGSLRTQQHFINNISHELKTPLTSIRAYTDLLHMYEDDPGLVGEARDVIDKEAERLYELVEKVLKLAVLEKYEFEQQPEKIRIDSLLEDLSFRMRGKAEKFGVTISHALVPAELWADRESLIQIFLNLLDNAIKYNVENGTVLIRSRITEEGGVEVEFTDTGLGIPEDRRERIFEPFYTVNKDRARKSGGSGLGLSLVRQLVDKQHGQIRVEHPVKGGASFIVTFPAGDQ